MDFLVLQKRTFIHQALFIAEHVPKYEYLSIKGDFRIAFMALVLMHLRNSATAVRQAWPDPDSAFALIHPTHKVN